MKPLYRELFSCVQTALAGARTEFVPEMLSAELFALADAQQILPLVYGGLYAAGVDLTAAEEAKMKTLRLTTRDQMQYSAFLSIVQAFSENGIDHMPLKGCALKSLYPSAEMRLMGDIDILIREEQYEKIREVMLSLGFTEGEESDHELIWHKKPKIIVELHKRLIPSYNDDYYEYYKDPWRFATSAAVPHRYTMRREDEYLYIFTHLTKHYRDGGIGARQLIDLWRYAEHHADMDKEYIAAELEKLSLIAFHENILTTLAVWFGYAPPTSVTEHITERIMDSGAFGLKERKAVAAAAKDSARADSVGKAKRKKILNYLFIPLPLMQKRYPVLEKAPVLLPVFWIVRFVTALLGRRDHIRTIAAEIDTMDASSIENYNRELAAVGLGYDLRQQKDPRKKGKGGERDGG